MQQWCHRPQNVGPIKLNVTVLWCFSLTRAGLTSCCNMFYVVWECVAFIWCTTYSQCTLYRQYCQRLYSQMGTLYRLTARGCIHKWAPAARRMQYLHYGNLRATQTGPFTVTWTCRLLLAMLWCLMCSTVGIWKHTLRLYKLNLPDENFLLPTEDDDNASLAMWILCACRMIWVKESVHVEYRSTHS